MPISMASAPASADGADHLGPVVAEPAGHVGDEQLAARSRASRSACSNGPGLGRSGRDRQPGLDRRVGAAHPRISIIWATSLSPRPDRFTRTVDPASAARSRLDPGQRVGRLERRDDALGPAEELEGVDHLGVGDLLVAGPADGRQVGVLGPDTRVVEAGRDRLGLLDLPELVLHQVALHAVDDPGDPPARPPRRPAGSTPTSSAAGVDEPGEDADGVGAAADAGGDHVGHVPVEQRRALGPGLVAR